MPRSGVYVLSSGVGMPRREGLNRLTNNNLLGLARALAASSMWKEMQGAVLVVRQGRQPLLGLVGSFEEADEARIESLRWQLQDRFPRYISYAEAEEDCEKLAAQLIGRFGRDEVRRFHYLAIPRGGLIVLGMLSYILGLPPAQLGSFPSPNTPLVVADDCAISGVRFGRFLEQCGNSTVVFAHLYSHPDLRKAIEAREPRVIACLSAQDLVDHAREQLGEEYDAWRDRWLARPNSGYWVGQPEQVCFAWNEPDISIWNSATGKSEAAWRVVPPELCLKNRPSPGAEPLRVQVQPEGKGPLKPAARTLFGELDGKIFVANTETGLCFALTGTAAEMWRKIVEHGSLAEVETELLSGYDVDRETLRGDLSAFVEQLLSQGLLER